MQHALQLFMIFMCKIKKQKYRLLNKIDSENNLEGDRS